jgi:Na+-driven multidrug efflux pump
MRAAVLALLLNLVLDPLLIVGWGPLPGLGVAGAAWATLGATAVPVTMLGREALRRGWLARGVPDEATLRLDARTPLGRPGLFGLDRTIARRMLRVGLPSAVASAWFNVVYLLLYEAVEAAGGAAAQAGLYVGHLGEGVAFVVGLGFSAAAASLVGRELGAGRPDDAARLAWRAAWQCAAISALWGAVLLIAHEPLARAFTPHAESAAATAHAAAYLGIVALVLAPQAIELTLDGAFGGAGMTVPPMVAGITLSTARVPLAWWAVDAGHGTTGIWWVIAATAGVRALVVALWFRAGTWRTRSV